MSTGEGGSPVDITQPASSIDAHVSEVTGGQVAVGGRIFQIDAAQGSYVVINAESDVEVVRRPSPVLRPPPAFPALVGRTPELRRIRSALDVATSVEVYGPGGIGKTALLRAASNATLPDSTPDGVVAIPARLGTTDTLSYVFDACYVGTHRVVPRREELISALSDLRLLVVLDDTSLSRDDIDEVRAALPSCVFLLAGIEQRVYDGVEGVPLAGLTVDEAVELIQAGIARELTEREKHVGARVSEVLRGTPLELVRFASLVRADDGDLVSVARGFGVDAQPEDLLVAVMRNVSVEEESVLAALSAFDAPVGAGPVAALSGHTDAGALLYALCERGLVQGDDLQGWRVRSRTAASPEERQRAAVVLTAWVRRRSVPEEVAGEIPAIASVLRQARQDHRWDDAIALAAAAERPLALAGRWSAWRDTLEVGRHAARLSGDDASVRFFNHQLGVIDEAMTGVIPVVHGAVPPSESSGAAPHTPDAGDSVEVDQGEAPIEIHTKPRWGRVIAAVVGLLGVIALIVAGVTFLPRDNEPPGGPTTQPSPTGSTVPEPSTEGPDTGGPGSGGTSNLTAYTLKSEPAQLGVGDTKQFTVRVWNKPLESREIGDSEAGTLSVTLSGPEATLVGGTPGCSGDSTGVVCTLPALSPDQKATYKVTLQGVSAGEVMVRMAASTSNQTYTGKKVFTVGETPCTVPSVVGLEVGEAQRRVEDAGLTAVLVPVEDGAASGRVIEQDQLPGSQPGCGTEVTLKYSGVT